jgi:SHS2 domain-containing protein
LYELIPHTADVRLRVEAATREELFLDAMRGMFAVMHGRAGEGARAVGRRVAVVESADFTYLLVDFLNEVLQRAHVGREMFDEVRFVTLTDDSVEADLRGFASAEFDEDVKAVTYHEAEVRHENGLWSTMLVFDL